MKKITSLLTLFILLNNIFADIYDGYILFTPGGSSGGSSATTYLKDTDNTNYNTWTHTSGPASMPYLIPGNEPGFENEVGERNDLYNKIVQHDTFKHLILNNAFKMHPDYKVFEPVIHEYMNKNRVIMLDKVDALLQEFPKRYTISLNIYGITMIIDYKDIKKKLTKALGDV